MLRKTIALLYFAAALAGLILVLQYVQEARAHQAPSGWVYPKGCCNGTECAPVPYSSVRMTAHGYEVRLEPGDHPLVKNPVTIFIPFEKARLAGDQEYHVCYRISFPHYWCFFAPPGAV